MFLGRAALTRVALGREIKYSIDRLLAMEGLKEVATVADKATETNRVISAVQVWETYREKLPLEPRAKLTSSRCLTLARGEDSSSDSNMHVTVGVTQFEVTVLNNLTKILQVLIPV